MACVAAMRLAPVSNSLHGARRPLRSGVQRLVDEPVRELVVLAADGGVGDRAELTRETRSLQRQLAEGLVLDLVLAAHLLDEQLGIGDNLELGHPARDR